jgi:hypothetical protein
MGGIGHHGIGAVWAPWPEGRVRIEQRHLIGARSAGHTERDEHPPAPIVLTYGGVAGIDAVERDPLERPLLRELASSPDLHPTPGSGLRHHEPLTAPPEQRWIGHVIRSGEDRSRLADPARAQLGDGNRTRGAVSLRAVFEKHECPPILLREKRIGIKAVRRRVDDREPIVGAAPAKREHPLFLQGAEHLLPHTVAARPREEAQHLSIRRPSIDAARVGIPFVVGVERLERVPPVAVEIPQPAHHELGTLPVRFTPVLVQRPELRACNRSVKYLSAVELLR